MRKGARSQAGNARSGVNEGRRCRPRAPPPRLAGLLGRCAKARAARPATRGAVSMTFWGSYDFWRDSMAAVLIAGGMCAALGVYVVLRRVVFVGAALTQISGVGVALAFWLGSFVGAAADPHDAPIWLDPRRLSLGP